ncbi:MAG TPA: DUF2752 domain-containing protein [Bryobacteraceae bacterium]|nr:DUF2752 domain-containing protein [Bryobacteraceae bacterium]
MRFSVRQQALTALAASIVLAGILRWLPPSRYAFYPPCPIHAVFGVLCPGCGATRALAALLEGDWAKAARMNLLAVASAPGLAAFATMQLYSAFRWNRWRRLPASPPAAKGLLTVALLFGLARNLAPLSWGLR